MISLNKVELNFDLSRKLCKIETTVFWGEELCWQVCVSYPYFYLILVVVFQFRLILNLIL